MKKSFPGHFPPLKREIDKLWEDCLFTVDANILLNLYRYSDSTRDEFLRILKIIKNRLWLPHYAAQEYFNNRLSVIAQQEKAYEEAIKTLKTFQEDLSNVRQHPFLSEGLMKKLSAVFGEITGEFSANKELHAKRAHEDEIQHAIADLFKGRIGEKYSEEQLTKICKEGEDRYARKIPPGYKDDGKDESSPVLAKYRQYGDLINWKQIMEKSRELKKGIIFVNDDKKEDWWLIFKGKTMGPRPELISEFSDETGNNFHMYQADRFLEYAATYLRQKVTAQSMDEIRSLSNYDRALRNERTLSQEKSQEEVILRRRLRHLTMKVRELMQLRNMMGGNLAASVNEGDEELKKMAAVSDINAIEKEILELRKERSRVRYMIEHMDQKENPFFDFDSSS